MNKVVLNYDIKNSAVKIFINNIEVKDIFSIFMHRDITNSFKYTFEIVSDEGRVVLKNGKVISNKNNDVFVEKFLSYFRSEEDE